MLNYDPMKRLNLRLAATLLAIVPMLSACSGPADNSASSNANASQQANANASAQTPGTPNAPLPLQTITPPDPNAAAHAGAPPEKVANSDLTKSKAKGPAPKLIAPEKKISFGKQDRDKSLVRAIRISNGGRAVLNIESVVPS